MQRALGCVALGSFILACVATAQAAPLLVAGSPPFDPVTNWGLKGGNVYATPGSPVNNSGAAVGNSVMCVSTSSMGWRAVRWDGSGTAGTELGGLGTSSSGYRSTITYAINEAGTVVGYADKYVGGGSMGGRAVRWNALGTDATELDCLGTDSSGYGRAEAHAVNNAGTAVGSSNKYVGGTQVGQRAVRWDASGTAATELGILGTDSSGYSSADAVAVNAAGAAVGSSKKYVGGGDKGTRAVRWEASGSAVTELDALGTSSAGGTFAAAYAINDSGTAVGYANKYVGGTFKWTRAVRWDASTTAATELGTLGTSSSGDAQATARAVNRGGTAVGYSDKYVNGNQKGRRAVRWDVGGTAATELASLGTSSSGYTWAEAYALNDAGTAVGDSYKYVAGSYVGYYAVIWLPDASVINLNDLGIMPVSEGGTWTLTSARGVSADGWVAGTGKFDPDGAGPWVSYERHWVTQVGLGGNWTKPDGGPWGRGPMWSTGTPAMQVGDATFDLDAAYTVALDRDELTKTVNINKGTVTLDFAGHKLSTESGLTIATGATLKGAGTIASDIQNAGTIAPGTSPGTLIVDGDLANTGALQLEIADLLDHDHIDVTGDFSAGGLIVLKLLGGYTPSAGDTFDFLNFGTFRDSGFDFDFSQASLPSGLIWDTTSFSTTGDIGVSAIPEPGTLALLLAGLVSLAIVVARRR